MDENHLKALRIFSPYYLNKAEFIQRENIIFIQYTSAEAAMNIIKTNEVWLRNAQCMNDYSEVEHGLNCLATAFKSEKEGQDSQALLNSIFPGIIDEFITIFDSWLPSFTSSTYIACVSEHPLEENLYGRLSMWRAYGGKNPVALVLNKEPFLAETDAFHAYTSPVAYLDPEQFSREFDSLSSRIRDEIQFIQKLGRVSVKNYLFDVFKNIILCVKHPAFKEEREWRVAYNPDHLESKYVRPEILTIEGIPQEVHKIPLIEIPDKGFSGATIPNFIDEIIIGPCDNQLIIGKTFSTLLGQAGCKKPGSKIRYSGIPIRQNLKNNSPS